MTKTIRKLNHPNAAKGGFSAGKLISLLFVTGLIGGGVLGGKYWLSQEEKQERQVQSPFPPPPLACRTQNLRAILRTTR